MPSGPRLATRHAGVAGIDAAAAKPDMASVRRAADRTAAWEGRLSPAPLTGDPMRRAALCVAGAIPSYTPQGTRK